jgi:6-phosphogluconolactonase
MLQIFSNLRAMAEAAAWAVEHELCQGLKTRGRASLVATGGRAPGPVFDRMTGRTVDWARVIVTLSDERQVPPTSPDSNARLVRERLLTGERAKAHFVPLWGPDETPEQAVARAERALEVLIPFDAVMLGMGEDGHIASLIPGSPALAEGMDLASDRLAIAVPEGSGSPPLARITLTLTALLQARAIFLLVAGEAKRGVIARAQGGEDLPVRAILSQDRVPVRILWSPSHEPSPASRPEVGHKG